MKITSNYEEYMMQEMLDEIYYINDFLDKELEQCVQHIFSCLKLSSVRLQGQISPQGKKLVHGARKDMHALTMYWTQRLSALLIIIPLEERREFILESKLPYEITKYILH